jgi:hypothetical protein
MDQEEKGMPRIFAIPRRIVLAPAAMLLASCMLLRAEDYTQDFSGEVIDTSIWNAYPGVWRLTMNNTLHAPHSPGHKNCTLTTTNLWALEALEVRLRVAPSAKSGSHVVLGVYGSNGGLIFVKFFEKGTRIQYKTEAAAKLETLPFLPGERTGEAFETWALTRTGKEVAILREGEEVARVPASCATAPARWRLVTTWAEVEVDRVRIAGTDVPERTPRIGTPLEEINAREDPKGRFYPDAPVVVDALAEGVDLAPAEGLPAVTEWRIGEPDFRWEEFSQDNSPYRGKAVADIRVGEDDASSLLWRLVWFDKRDRPQRARFFFRLAEGGDYTVQFYLAGAKNLANMTHVTLDGHPLLSDIMRGATPSYIHSL